MMNIALSATMSCDYQNSSIGALHLDLSMGFSTAVFFFFLRHYSIPLSYLCNPTVS